VAGATVVVGTAIGVVTNLITSKWSIGLAVGLGVLLVVGVALQVAVTAREDPADSGGATDMPSHAAVRQDARARGHATVIQAGGDVNVKPDDEPASLQGKKPVQ
jgi:hypothetical protein